MPPLFPSKIFYVKILWLKTRHRSMSSDNLAMRGFEVLPPMVGEPANRNDRSAGTDTRGVPNAGVVSPTKTSTGSSATPKKQGRFEKLNSFVDVTLKNLTMAESKVWLILYRDERDGIVQTSQVSIAKRAGLSERSVTTAVRLLQKRGLLHVLYQGGLNRGTSRYRLHATEEA